MTEKLAYWASVFLSSASIVLLIGNIVMIEKNHALQEEVTHRQAALNEGTNLSQLNQGLINTLADLAAKNNDRDLRTLLATQGFVLKSDTKPAETLKASTPVETSIKK